MPLQAGFPVGAGTQALSGISTTINKCGPKNALPPDNFLPLGGVAFSRERGREDHGCRSDWMRLHCRSSADEFHPGFSTARRPDFNSDFPQRPLTNAAMNPSTTALILVGYQNDYFAPKGILRGVVEEPNRVDSVLANSLEFIRAVAPTPMLLIATPIVLESDYRALANSVGILDTIKSSGAFKAGTPGAETIPELLAFGERITYVRGKVGFNAFSNTDLETVLRERGIRDVLVAGMVTSLCIDSTGRAAYERGYSVRILSDCTSARTRSEQEFFCKNIFPLYGGVVDSREAASQILASA